jgi:hypothetical protein
VSFQAVKLVQYTEGLTLAEYGVLISLASLADKDDWRCSPSLTALAAISNIEKKTAIRAIRRLTAPYVLPDRRSLVSIVESRKQGVRNHTYELNIPLLRELREKRRKRVPAMRSKRRNSVPTTPLTDEVKTDITHLSRKQVRESIAAAVKQTVERARALAATPPAPSRSLPLYQSPDGDLKSP